MTMTDTIKETTNLISTLQKEIIENVLWKNNITDDDEIFQTIMGHMTTLNRLVGDFNRYREDHFTFFQDLLTMTPAASKVALDTLTLGEVKELVLSVANEIRDARRIMTDWQRLQTHLNDNPAAMAEWKRFMMTLKLTGGDQNTPEEE